MTAVNAAFPAVDMLRLLGGFQLSQALFVVARAGVADQLVAGPRPLTELAAAVGLRPEPLARILHVLAAEEVFTVDAERALVGLGRLGPTLVSGGPESLRNIALAWEQTHYRAFGELWGTALTGVPAADLAYGKPFFDHLGEHPAQVATFTAAMTDFARAIRHHALDAVELAGAQFVVDIGGADGAVLAELARREPGLRGTVLDLPHVVAAAPEVLRAAGVADRITATAGDFFAALPPADCYLACFILHDWSDERATRILDRVHRAATAPDTRLVVVDTVLDGGTVPEVATLLDLTMLGMLTGRERTAAAWRALFTAGGFELTEIRPTPGPMCVLEARRVP
ncbi:methyltransferase [Kitasatospora viridis]|uniref:O-methyltransferase n=1 Tax=Kitasatospora viridis TaxID=281105 RepID=A0A561UDE4_9ACTN|nr:O-methyltransferase [Kitasatospora viridis]